MEYILISFENIQMWMEIEKEGYALRQIVKDEDDIYHLSCMEDCLAEGVIKKEDLAGKIISIKKEEFEEKWNNLKKIYEEKWREIKRNNPIEKKINGKCKYYYPQGYILDVEGGLGLLKDNSTIDVNIGDIVQGIITGYDDINMWLLITLL